MIKLNGYFGKKEHVIIEEPKKETTNPFIEYKKVLSGFSPDPEMLVPLINWFSNHKANLNNMQKINEKFFTVPKSVLSRNLVLNINRSIKFIKYPKKNKQEHELGFLIPYVQKHYNWSDREWEYYRQFIDLENTELHQMLHKLYVFTKSECRKLGIKQEKIKAKFQKPKPKGFFV